MQSINSLRLYPAVFLSCSGWLATAIWHLSLALLVMLCLSTGRATAAEQNYDTLVEQALTYRNDGNFVAAEQSLRQARDLASDTREVDYLLGMVLAFQERFEESMGLLDSALDTYPSDTQLQLAKGRVHSYLGQYSQSLTWVNRVLADQPDNLEALVLSARVNFYNENYA